ncbi:expressed unknown protein [Seminavis robusta]|uniref:Uncharacterized protein n=1 Tax=Seminavis robusta TaxID=568900 RepID=A0A9N8DJ53_9STRA|nr:expressed unknown protein [Seminavis robusta]|eukprot:Sro172_g076030.1 n/a (1161) ;mRNA; f:61610-65506
MYRSKAKGHGSDVDNKAKTSPPPKLNNGSKGKRRAHMMDSPNMTGMEYFIYVCTILFVCVFGVMQGVFLYKLHVYEASFDAEQQTKPPEDGATNPAAQQQQLQQQQVAISSSGNTLEFVPISNRQRMLQFANATHKQYESTPAGSWPPLDALVDTKENKVIGNPQFLLDVAILGFEKAGTYTMKLILNGHKETDGKLAENIDLYNNQPHQFVIGLYDHHPNQDFVRFYVNNWDIYQPCSLKNIHTYFSETKFIITIRHPVRFFESVYNARIQNVPDPNKPIPTPHERIGFCRVHDNSCCTDHAHLALWLYKLGKTVNMPQGSEIEDIIKNTHAYEANVTTLPTKNKVFLVETSQLVDQDWFRQEQLLQDLQAFLGLQHPFTNGIPPPHPAARKSDQDIRDKRKIDICHSEYDNLREELMQGARESSIWLRERFLKSKDVFTTSPEFLEKALLSWMDDPCDKKIRKDDLFDTRTIEQEIPFVPSTTKKAAVQVFSPGSLKKYDTSETWPPLAQVVNGDRELIADPQFLLDFAIIGIEKCGTSTLMKWLGGHSEVQCFQQEEPSLFMNQPGVLAKRLYKVFPGEQFKRGYKNPIDLFQPCVLRNFQEVFPETKLILTIRHPVRYFESLHNFRIQNLPDPNDEFTPPLERIGICNQYSQGLCTDHAHFALWIYRLGKTVDMPKTEIQRKIIDTHPWEANHYTYPSTNKVFLVEMSQLQDNDPERTEALKQDLATFLELKHTFDQEAPHFVPGMKWSTESQAIRDSRKIDICEDQYRPLRAELMKGARETSLWITTFFLASKDVFISSPEFFDQAMKAWMNDPCEDESQKDPRSMSNWPRLNALVNDDLKIIGDPQFLLDFAIIGVEKCGTSTLMVWLGAHPEVQCPQEENYSLMHETPGQLVQDMYAQAPYEDYKRGYKNPLDLFYPGSTMKYIDQYFPKTKLIVTLRHPIRYFESLYNFRIQNHNQGNWNRSHIATPIERIGPCVGQAGDGCTEHAHFGLWLYRLGKTLSLPETETEKKLYEKHPDGTRKEKPKAMQNQVFLCEMTQFADKDPVRSERLKNDLRDYLGLTKNFNSSAPHKVPGKKWTPEIQAVRDSFKINICDEKWIKLREALMQGARETSLWIRESFMKSPDVHFSSPDFLNQAFENWMDDPCDNEDENGK